MTDVQAPVTISDSQIIEWLQEHSTHFRLTLEEKTPYRLTWLDGHGYDRITYGKSLRNCVDRANRGMYDDTKPSWEEE